MFGGQAFETHLAGAWYFGMPGGPSVRSAPDSSLPTIASLALVFGGLILLSRVWFGFLRHLSDHPGFPVKRVVLVVAIWAVPLLLAPPLFSRDVYTYSAQGEMMSHHINPYSYGPEVLGATPFNQMADTVWSGTESPYGPTFLSVDGLLDQASGHQILPDLVLLRLLEVAGLALAVAATPTLARSLKHDPAHAVLIGVGSPLALLALIGGAHNDALMVGLLVAGLAVAKRFGTVPGVILCALAAGVKSPALLGVLFLGWVWAGREASIRRRIGHTALAGLIALATMEVVSLVSGTGLGLDPHDDHRGRHLHRGHTHQSRGPVRLHRQPCGPGPDRACWPSARCSWCSDCWSPSTSGTASCSGPPGTASSAAWASPCSCWRCWAPSCGRGTSRGA